MNRIILLCLLTLGCSFTLKEEPGCVQLELYKAARFPIGVAINTDKLKDNERYWTVALAQFNSFTPEKILKPQYIHPAQDRYDFFEAGHLMEFCKRNNIRLHGHALLWHNALPQWMEKFKGFPAEWDAMMKDHIQRVVTQCRGVVRSWDVVNEAFNDDGSLRENVWFKNIGADYLERAFIYAREADSTARLFYNDYSLEENGAKLEAVLTMVNELRRKGIRVDGIGMQMHVSLTKPAITNINAAAKKIEKAGLLVHYSELDVSLSADQPLFASGKKLKAQQRERYREIVAGYMQIDPRLQFGITLWGVSDNDSWLMEDRIRSRPLLFNTRYKLKPAYCGFLEGLRSS